MRELNALQTWMQTVVTHPLGLDAGLQAASVSKSTDERLEIDSMICPSRAMSNRERLAIYGNAYFARLLECLGEEFPTVHWLLGDDAFRAICTEYLQAQPSRGYSLNDLGAGLPNYLQCTRPDSEPTANSTDFLIEVALLERTYAEVFDGPGIESGCLNLPSDFVPLEDFSFEAVRPSEIGDLRFIAAPSLRLLALRFPTHEFISEVRRYRERVSQASSSIGLEVNDPAAPEPQSTYLVVTRRDFVVRRSTVNAIEYHLLHELVAGASLGIALERSGALQQSAISADDIRACFSRWAAARWLIGINGSCG